MILQFSFDFFFIWEFGIIHQNKISHKSHLSLSIFTLLYFQCTLCNSCIKNCFSIEKNWRCAKKKSWPIWNRSPRSMPKQAVQWVVCSTFGPKYLCWRIEIINNIARHNLIDAKYHQMAFRSARWRCSRALFGSPWSNKSEWWPPEGDNPWNLLFSSWIVGKYQNTVMEIRLNF